MGYIWMINMFFLLDAIWHEMGSMTGLWFGTIFPYIGNNNPN
jgi:hypothetical protein